MDQNKMEITQKTAQQIKYYRMQQGLSQETLAHAAGLNPAFLGHIERSLKCPTIDTLNKIAYALNLTLSELLDFDKHEETDPSRDRKAKAIQKINILIQDLSEQKVEEMAIIIADILKFQQK